MIISKYLPELSLGRNSEIVQYKALFAYLMAGYGSSSSDRLTSSALSSTLSAVLPISPVPDARVQERPSGAEEAGNGDRRRPSAAGSPHRGTYSGTGGDQSEKVSSDLQGGHGPLDL